ncbi:MAG: CDP-alcohol phosphatidyltransferase family protein [Anaerotignum sp.]|nr:CDP-alcohol phosphatidyltransferase family protein [Anaerotignum sp.]
MKAKKNNNRNGVSCKMKKQLANCITMSRVLGSILMLFFPVFSVPFYALYLFCGVTDMVDGTIARKTGAVSEFGEKLDSFADFLFLAVSLVKFLPAMDIPVWMWFWCIIIAGIKVCNMAWGIIFMRKLIIPHTIMNKLTGLLLFLLPLTLPFIVLQYSAVLVCAIATFSAIQEGHRIRNR